MLGAIRWVSIPGVLLILVLVPIGWVTSNAIPHSVSMNLLIPMDVGLAISVSTNAAKVAIIIVLGCSLGICLPISAPPNAVAYLTGTMPTREMMVVGVVVGLVGIIPLTFVAPLTWGVIEVM